MDALAEIEAALPQCIQRIRCQRVFKQESNHIIGGIVEQTADFVRCAAGGVARKSSQRVTLVIKPGIRLVCVDRRDVSGKIGRRRSVSFVQIAPKSPLLPEAIEIDSRHDDEANGQQAQLKFTHI